MAVTTRKRLGEIIVEAGLITNTQLARALAEQKKTGLPLGRTLTTMGIVSESQIVAALSLQLNIPAIEVQSLTPDPKAMKLLDIEFCQTYSCIPFAYEEQGKFLSVAMADPTNPEFFDQIRVKTKSNLRPFIAGPDAIEKALRRIVREGISLDEGGDIELMELESAPPSGSLEVQPLGASLSGLPKQKSKESKAAIEPGEEKPSTRVRAMRSQKHKTLMGSESIELSLDDLDGSDEEFSEAPQETDGAIALPPLGTSEPTYSREFEQLFKMLRFEQQLLRRLMDLLVEKGICTTDELNRLTRGE